jgi:hypothetical protein
MKKLAWLVIAMLSATASAQTADPLPPPGPAPVPAPPPAAAGVCVTIDPTRDTLAEGERVAARSLVLQAFETERLATDASGTACSETYVVSNIKLGNTINVTITGPRGQRTGRATSLDDLPNVYSQMIKSLVLGVPMETGGGGAVDRTNVTKDQSAPRRVQADNLKYVQLGYGGIMASGSAASGPAFGTGWRKELDRIALDIALTLLFDNSELDGITMAIPKLTFLWNQTPTADATVYYGLGVSFGISAIDAGAEEYGGSGMQGQIAAGYTMFRSSTIRGFVQLDVTLPFYKSGAAGSDATRWTPSAFFSLGFGWGKTSTVVRVINE